MSDGYRDAAIEQERYFERLRTRLLEEEALYGEYNPETCPNVIRGGDDWCAAGGPCRAMWCEGCNAHLGPWGAWRAVGREVSWRAEVISEMAREYDTDRLNLGALFVSLGMYIEIRIYLDASGWSL